MNGTSSAEKNKPLINSDRRAGYLPRQKRGHSLKSINENHIFCTKFVRETSEEEVQKRTKHP